MANPLRSNPANQFASRPHDACPNGAVPQYPLVPCGLGRATHHHLDCGDLVRTNVPSLCGANCAKTPAAYPTRAARFACTRCIDALLDAKVLQHLALLGARVDRRTERADHATRSQQGLEDLSWEGGKWRAERVKTEETLRAGTRECEDVGDAAEWEEKIYVRVLQLDVEELAKKECTIRTKRVEHDQKVKKGGTLHGCSTD